MWFFKMWLKMDYFDYEENELISNIFAFIVLFLFLGTMSLGLFVVIRSFILLIS